MTVSHKISSLITIPALMFSLACGQESTISGENTSIKVSEKNRLESKIKEQEDTIKALKSEKENSDQKVSDIEKLVPENGVAPQESSTVNLDASAQLLQDLKAGLTIPFLIFAYGEPSSPLFDTVRMQYKTLDANPVQNENRERQFTGYPYTIMMSIITIKTLADYEKVLSFQSKWNKIKVMAIPIQTFQTFSYTTLDYSAPVFGRPISKTLWIGSSQEINLRGNYSDYRLSDISTYLPFMTSCRSFDLGCLKTLLEHGYFQQTSTVETKTFVPLDAFRKQVAESAYLREKGFNGHSALFGKGVLNSNYDRRLVSNIKLSHELWVNSKGYNGPISPTLYKVTGFDHRPVVVSGPDGTSLFKLPVRVTETDIPLDIRSDSSQMTTFTKQLVGTIDSFNAQKAQVQTAP